VRSESIEIDCGHDWLTLTDCVSDQ